MLTYDELVAKVTDLNREYEIFCKAHYVTWSNTNGNRPSAGSWSGSSWFRLMALRRERWTKYITPLAEDWWGSRGFTVKWPQDPYDPPRAFIKAATK